MASEAKWLKMTPCVVGRLQESVKGCNHIHCLSDELVMEILRRLPNCKSVLKCRSVCKRWATLSSIPWFIAQFIDLRFGGRVPDISDNKHQTFAIVMWYKPDNWRKLWQGSESFFRPSMFNTQDSSFSPFQCLGVDNTSATLVASWNDLLLYSRHEKDKKYDFYIGNAQTKQWAQLPSPPYYYGRVLCFGLICDPFYSCEREIVVNVAYRYSVVVIRQTSRPLTKFTAHVLSSTNRGGIQWKDRVLSLPQTCSFTGSSCSFCFDEKLYFPCREGIFGFNQDSIEFDEEIQCHLVKWPVMSFGLDRVSVSKENLTVSQLGDNATLRIWVLKDYKTSNWMLQHRIEIRDWVSPRKSWITKKLEKFSQLWNVYVLGFHPSKSEVIYMLVPGYILLCNLTTKTIELACRIPVAVAQRCKHYLSQTYDFPVMLQSWPTPLPRLSVGH
ncbi:uncharacterized protein LOC141598801 [Silene latifolia]|uniref:uncharacterized protein LOC141598801 n=1 Tax=Silene latifolia TaxID=37657 RepID=UPI003D76E3DF